MTGCEDPEFGALDAYIRTQLARAADTYASQIDMDAQLEAVLEATNDDDRPGATAADT